MRPTLFTIDLPGPGRLSTMARPRGNDWLEDEMAALKNCGVDVLVCALTDPELDELGLADESRAAITAGLQFVAIPIPDRTVPDLTTILPTLHRLAEQLHEGAHVVAHCRAGIGRSSLLVAALLILNGVDPDTSWHQIERARGIAVPDTVEQREWTMELLKWPPSETNSSTSLCNSAMPIPAKAPSPSPRKAGECLQGRV